MTIVAGLQLASAVAATLAAAFWFWSVKVVFPDNYSVHVVRPDALPLGGNPLGGTYVGHAYSGDFEVLTEGLRTQSRRNALAAFAAAVAAVLQALSLSPWSS
jgi:hypothetical protein